MQVQAVAALRDNYIHIAAARFGAGEKAVVIDPGEAAPALRFLEKHQMTVAAILLTHRHADHIGGAADVLRQHPRAALYGAQNTGAKSVVGEGDVLAIDGAGEWRVMATPGHTREHITFISGENIFCGDTLFAGGCGRLLDGADLAEELHRSLCRLAEMPAGAQIYGGHEYTKANLSFAAAVEPQNAAIQNRQKEIEAALREGTPSYPAPLALEKETNPFLRAHVDVVKAAAEEHAGCPLSSPAEVFAELRRWKDSF